MKVTKEKPPFQPITIKIKIESEQEHEIMRRLCLRDSSISELICSSLYFCSDVINISKEEVIVFLNEIRSVM